MAILVGQGPIALPGSYTSNPLSQTSPNPGAVPTAGTRAQDAAGNVYVLCDATATCHALAPVQILDDYTCTPITTAFRGRIGVAMTTVTSDYYVWVQIYGRTLMQVGMGGVSPSDAANGPTTGTSLKFAIPSSLSTPAALGYVSEPSTALAQVIGMWVASDASMGTDPTLVSAGAGVAGPGNSTTNHTGNQFAVFLNYPTVNAGDYGIS